MRKARIENGVVCEVLEATPFPPFHPSLVWVACAPDVVPGWTWDGSRFDAPPPPAGPTQADILKALTAALQDHLDTTARTRNYDGILSLCTYATSTNPRFRAEGQAGVEWRDAVWAAGYQVMADCLAGLRAIPTPEALVTEMPPMVWP